MRPIVILSLLTVIFAFLFFVGAQIGQDPRIYLDQAQKAYQEKNWEVYLQCCQKIHDLRPRNPQAVYNLAGACALAGKKEDAIVWLKRLSDLGLDYGIGQDPDFESLRETPEFKAILDNLAKMKVPVSHSQVAFQVSERDLIPESIAYDAVKEEFFLGSLYKRKIIKVDKIGRAEEFTSEGQDGLWSVIGIKVDAKRRILWAASAAESIMKGFQAGTLGYQTGIFKYDLRTKKLIQKYLIENPREKHLFNDLVVNVSGDVFITDYFHGAVWRIAAQKDKL